MTGYAEFLDAKAQVGGLHHYSSNDRDLSNCTALGQFGVMIRP